MFSFSAVDKRKSSIKGHSRRVARLGTERLESRELLTSLVWSDGPDLPAPRTDAVAVIAPDNAVYVLGGHSSFPTAVSRLTQNGTVWTSAPEIENQRVHVGAARSGSEIYLFGGTKNTEGNDEVLSYDYRFGDSQDVEKMNLVRYDHGYAADSLGRVYAIGGIGVLEDGEIWPGAERYDPQSDTWTTIAPLPQARRGAAAIGDGNGHIFVFGGSSSLDNSQIQGSNFSYDTSSNTWSTISPMPVATRDSASVVVDGGEIYVIGGMSSTGPTDVVQVYDPLSNSWAMQTDLPEARYSHAAAYDTTGRIIIAGGFDAGGNSSATVYRTQRLDIPESAPVVTSSPVTTATPSDPYTYDVNAVGNPDPQFSLVSAPDGMTIDAETGVINWQPTAAQAGDHTITARASNQAGVTEHVFEVTVVPDSGPVITSNAVTTASRGVLYVYDVDASGSPSPVFSLVVAPDGMTINSVTGTIAWQPAASQFGDIDVTVRALNRAGNTDQAFVITGLVDAIPPSIPINVHVDAVSTTSIDLSWTAAIDNVGVVHYDVYRVTRTAPRRFRPRRTVYTLVQTDVTTTSTTVAELTPLTFYKYVVRAVDAEGNESANSHAVETTTEAPPTLSYRSNKQANGAVNVIANHALDLQLTGTANPVASYSLVSGPNTMTVDPVEGVTSWTPIAADVGQTSVTFRATNAVGFVDLTVPVNVTADTPALSVQFIPGAGGSRNALAGSLFAAQINDSSNTVSTYELLSAPNTMVIDPHTGLMSWTPTPDDGGQQSVTARATNSAGSSDITFGFYTYFTSSVVNIQVSGLTETNPTATWSVPAGAGSDQVVGYTIEAIARWRAGRSRRSHRISYESLGTDTSFVMTDLLTRNYRLSIQPIDAAGNIGLPHIEVVEFAPRPSFPIVRWTVNNVAGGTSVPGRVIAGQPLEIVLIDQNTLPSTLELVKGPTSLTYDALTNTARWTPGAADVTTGYTSANVIFRATNVIGSRDIVVPIRVHFAGAIQNATAVRDATGRFATVHWAPPTDNVSPITSYSITRHWRWSGRRRSTTYSVPGSTTIINVGLVPRGAVSHRGVTITPIDANGNFGIATYVPYTRS